MKNNILETIGDTPIVKLNKISAGLRSDIWVKLEYLNPGFSVKDRIAPLIIEDAEKSGKLKPGGTIVEATSGNTGAGLAMVAAVKGYKCIFVMPDKMSQEKIDRLRGYGARVIITPTNVEPEDPRSYYCVADRLVKDNENAFLANQYHNPSNPESHYRMTGPEIWAQTEQKMDVFVAGMGTGGTISGVGKYLKEQSQDVTVVGVDTFGSILTNLFYGRDPGKAEPYKVEGIGEDFKPSNLNFDVIDEVVQVGDKESLLMTRRLAREEGIFSGGSGGSAVCGALKYAEQLKEKKTIVVLLPDSGLTYLSKIFSDEWMRDNAFLDDQNTVKSLVKDSPLIAATPDSLVSEIFGKMRDNGVSQIPIIEDGQFVGIVNEKDIYEYLIKSPQNDDHIQKTGVIQSNALKVKDCAPINDLHNVLSKNNAAVVVDEDDHPVDIITKTDVINYLFGQTK